MIEPLSFDDAYLDVTENLKGVASATQIAEEIRERIHSETRLTASAGISYKNSSPNSPLIIGSPTVFSSSPLIWGPPLSRTCRSGNSTESGQRRSENKSVGIKRGSISESNRLPFFYSISASPGNIITG